LLGIAVLQFAYASQDPIFFSAIGYLTLKHLTVYYLAQLFIYKTSKASSLSPPCWPLVKQQRFQGLPDPVFFWMWKKNASSCTQCVVRWLEKGAKIFQGVFIVVYKGSERSGEKTSSHLFRPINWVHVLVNFIRPMACCWKNKLTVIMTRAINTNMQVF
jgi:hypothetical protein